MAVVPAEPQGVVPDRLHPLELDVGPDRARVEDPLARPFVAARGAGAFAAEVAVGEAGDGAVVPGELEDLLTLEGADIRGDIAHREGSLSRRCGGSLDLIEANIRRGLSEWGPAMARFYVRAKSVNAVRKALGRAPGGVRVVGRYDRETIECTHTMEAHSLGRFWPILVSRLEKAGVTVVARPGTTPGGAEADRAEDE